MQILQHWLESDSKLVVTILLDICFAAAGFQNVAGLMGQLSRQGKKIGIFADCNDSEEAYGTNFSRLVCDPDLSEDEKKSILQQQSPCYITTSTYPTSGGLFSMKTC